MAVPVGVPATMRALITTSAKLSAPMSMLVTLTLLAAMVVDDPAGAATRVTASRVEGSTSLMETSGAGRDPVFSTRKRYSSVAPGEGSLPLSTLTLLVGWASSAFSTTVVAGPTEIGKIPSACIVKKF